MIRKTFNPLAKLGAAALACILAGCAAPAPEPSAESAPAPAISESTPTESFHFQPPATISLPSGPTAPKAGAAGNAAAPKPEAAQLSASGSGVAQTPSANTAATVQTSKADRDQPSGSAVAPMPTPSMTDSTSTQILPLDEAVSAAANDLFANAEVAQFSAGRTATGPPSLTVDPPVDGTTGFQSVATRAMYARAVKIVREQYPRYELKPFTAQTLAVHPLLLLGTITPVDKDGKTEGAREAFRICLALVDLQNGRVVSKGLARARPGGVDATPTQFFADSPVWAPDAATQSYVKTCHETKPGDPINPIYLSRLAADVLVNDGMIAFEAGRYEEAYQLFKSVQRAPGGEQLRAMNGLYLASQKLSRRDDAIRAFAQLIDLGLAQKQLAIKFAFRPGSASFVEDPKVSGEYAVWLSVISQIAERRSDCVEVSAYAQGTGRDPPNERLSLLRAQYIMQRIDAASETIANRIRAVGNRENPSVPGTGSALDDRIQFRVLACKPKSS